jgi:tetratricopeptide (TPR) repeat protein
MRLQRVLVAAVTAISGLCLSACGQLQLGPPSSWDQFLQAADTAVSQKKFDEAEKDCQMAVDDAEKKHADDPTIFVIAASHYAEIETGRGKYKEAEQLYGRALKLVEQHLPPDNPEVIKLEKSLAQVLTKDGKEKEAKQLLSNRSKLIQKAKQDKAKQDAASRKNSSGRNER